MPTVFDHVVIVVLENASRTTVLTNKYLSGLRRQGVFLENSYGITHPSQPNYFTLVGGDTLGFYCDAPGWVTWYQHQANPNCSALDVTSIVDLLEAKGLTWKAYAEDLAPEYIVRFQPPAGGETSGCTPYDTSYIPGDKGNFARRHVPFLSFPNIVNTARAANIVTGEQFQLDVDAGQLPHYSFYTPNLVNDGHQLPTGQPANPVSDTDQLLNIEQFLRGFLSNSFPPKTLIVITFDEAYPVAGPTSSYNVYTLLIGDFLQRYAGTSRLEAYNHYSLLRTIEDNFGLGTLGRNDDAARPYWFIEQAAPA